MNHTSHTSKVRSLQVFEFNFLICKTDAFAEFQLTHLVRYNATNVEGDTTKRFPFPPTAFSAKNNVATKFMEIVLTFSMHYVNEIVGEDFWVK